ncbi:uncharacterized protein LOC133815551 [Humulus lupulus]|uniref:uncharacterized protein LOC133815551 n=1 Tax=Humulus lupulus TaxID=3486 RepID=UPI002B416DB1|nr:uncharacterized protein LOC133815551 [Humulus lupulus]
MSSAVMQHHGGDGGANPPPNPTQIQADCEREIIVTTKTKRRGINKGFSTREARVALGRPLTLEWDVRGKTYKEIGDYSQHFSREIGILIRQYADPDYDRWDKVPSEVRDRILPRLEDDLFDIGRSRYASENLPGILLGIQRSCADRYSEWKNDLSTHLKKNGRAHPTDGLVVEKWQKAFQYFDRPEVKRRSETNSANRAKQKQRSVQGSQSTPALRYKKHDLQTGCLAGVPEIWMATKYIDGEGWVSKAAKDNYEKMIEIRDTLQSQSSTSASASSTIPREDDDIILVETIFGRRRGYQPGLGRRIRTRANCEAAEVPQPAQPPPTAQDMQEVRERLRAIEEHLARIGGVSGFGSSQQGHGADPTTPS